MQPEPERVWERRPTTDRKASRQGATKTQTGQPFPANVQAEDTQQPKHSRMGF